MKRYIQALSLLLFSTFFFLATYKLPDWFPADIYLRLDPLLGLNAIFAAREIIGRALWSLILDRSHSCHRPVLLRLCLSYGRLH